VRWSDKYRRKYFERLHHKVIEDIIRSEYGGSILDIGAGEGEILKAVREKFDEIYAIEIDSELCSELRKIADVVICDDAFKVDIDRKFDVIVCMFFMCLFDREKRIEMLKKIYDWLKDDGIAYVCITNSRNVSVKFAKALGIRKRYDAGKDFEEDIMRIGYKIVDKFGVGVLMPVSLRNDWRYVIIPNFVCDIVNRIFDDRLTEYCYEIVYKIKKARGGGVCEGNKSLACEHA